MFSRCVPVALVAIVGFGVSTATAQEQPRRGVVAGGPAYKIELLLLERILNDPAGANDAEAPRVLAPIEADEWRKSARAEATNKVLSSPVIVTLEGREAHMSAGGEHVFVVGYNDKEPILKHIRVGTELKTTPRRLADGRVSIDLSLCVTELGSVAKAEVPAGPGEPPRQIELPTTSQRAVQTTVVLPLSGASVVIGENFAGDGARRRNELLISVSEFHP